MLKIMQRTNRFIRNEDGIATAWAIGWLILCFSIAGLSIDATNAWKIKQILQSTADAAAHAGGLELGTVGNSGIEAAVIVAANQYATNNMNVARYGDVLVDSDIQTGNWNEDTKVFTEMTTGTTILPDAVRVTTRQDGVNSSKVGTFFLRFVGFDAFTVSTTSVVQSFISQCEKDGLMSRLRTSLPGDNHFYNKYCVHGQIGVSVANHNEFESGTIVSMFSLDTCGTSSSILSNNTTCTDAHNTGIEEALNQNSMTFGKIDRLAESILDFQTSGLFASNLPEYIDTTLAVVYFSQSDMQSFDATVDLVEGALHIMECGNSNVSLGSAALVNNNGLGNETGEDTIVPDITLQNMVIVGSGCSFSFDQTVSYESAMIMTDDTGSNTFSGSADVRLGRDDNCTQGGEVVLATLGSVDFAAKISAYDLEIIASESVSFAAQGNTADEGSIHEGTNIWAGGDIDMRTGQRFSGCDGATDPTYDIHYTLRYVK
ncbi:hypothetical protein A9Q96_15060 [Rhodobacterales bacterium 52_120_T64]|nr:hypothetical protein A9Q96_15060 [Rhodobacterales bacterium 52_120_T64]